MSDQQQEGQVERRHPSPGMGDSYICRGETDPWDGWIPVHDEPLNILPPGEITFRPPVIPSAPYRGGTTASPAPGRCNWCGDFHIPVSLCPKLQEIEYHENGTVKRVVMR